jgi:hypothetical protein
MKFRTTKTTGLYSRKTFVCPECKEVMRERTIKAKFSYKEWARYLYLCIRIYKESDYFGRISWEKLKGNLRRLGISSVFWEEWNDIKEECSGLSIKELWEMLFDLVIDKGIKPKATTIDTFIN